MAIRATKANRNILAIMSSPCGQGFRQLGDIRHAKIGQRARVRDNNLRDCIPNVSCRAHRAANWNTNTIEYYSGVLASPLVSPLREMVLPVSLLGLALGLVVVTRRSLCTIGSAFRHPIPFRNPRRLVKRFVSAPFLFAGR